VTIRVRLTARDLRNIRLRPSPAPLEGVVTAARHITASGAWHAGTDSTVTVGRSRLAAPHFDGAQARLAMDLASLDGRPGFLDVHAENLDAAVDHLMSASPQQVLADLRGVAERGVTLPAWTADLIRGDRGFRSSLAASLRYVHDQAVTPRLASLAPLAERAYRGRQKDLTEAGVDRLLSHLHAQVRWIPPDILECHLSNPAIDFDTVSTGTGLELVPTPWLHSQLTIFLPDRSDSRPTMIFYPVDAIELAAQIRYDADRIAQLLGTTRARVLLLVAERPGLSIHELAAAAGISPASASGHAAVLRRNHLIATVRAGHRATHAITRLGRRLIT
jgi:DNA-binding transcriptional ArsR family regulator